MPASRQLEFHASQFNGVETNNTFYRLPTRAAVKGWQGKAPASFVYALKGSRFITHMKKLTNLDGALKRFLQRIGPLEPKLGVILWQLPPFLRKDPERLDAFLARLPRHYEYAVEFRHPSWLDEEIFAVLRRHGAGNVSLSSQAMPMNLTVTSNLVYVRFHGLAGGSAHDYTRDELEPWARHIREQALQARQSLLTLTMM